MEPTFCSEWGVKVAWMTYYEKHWEYTCVLENSTVKLSKPNQDLSRAVTESGFPMLQENVVASLVMGIK